MPVQLYNGNPHEYGLHIDEAQVNFKGIELNFTIYPNFYEKYEPKYISLLLYQIIL